MMREFITAFFLLWSCITGFVSVTAQELRAVVSVNSSAIQGGNSDLFHTLKASLQTLLNGERWGDGFSTPGDKIHCSFTLLLTERTSENSFRGELYVQSNGKGKGGEPGSALLVVRDREVDFSYTAHQPLVFDLYSIGDNLTAVVTYYAYLILALEQDAAEPLGGTPYFRKMEQIASAVQPYGWKGWEMSRRRGGRVALATAFNDGSLEEYRQMWFRLHNDPQLATASDAVDVLYRLHRERPGHPMLALFGDSHLQDLVVLLSQGNSIDREQWRNRLMEIYPTRGDVLNRMRE